jgi:Flp pilus assembly protein TadD
MRSITVLVLLAALAGCAAPGGRQDLASGDSAIKIADAALSAGSPEVALQVLDARLKAAPRDAEALVRQGKAFAMAGNITAADVSFRKALAVDGRNFEARLGLARLAMARDPAAAEQRFAALLKDQPANAAVLNNLGVARDMQGHHDQAQAAYRQALEVNPGMTSAQQNLALSLALSGQAEEGAAMLNRLADSGAGGRKLRDNLAVALAIAGNTAGAGQVLREEMGPADAARAIAAYQSLAAPAPGGDAAVPAAATAEAAAVSPAPPSPQPSPRSRSHRPAPAAR